jgi:hypothetical protein
MLASVLFPAHPAFAVALLLLVGASRIVRGYHTVPQVLVGWAFGVAVVFLRRAVDSFVLWNWVLALFLPLLAWFDPYLKGRTRPGNVNSPTVWCIGGFATIAFDAIVCPPPRFDCFSFLSMRERLLVAGVLKFVLAWTMQLLFMNGVTISFA